MGRSERAGDHRRQAVGSSGERFRSLNRSFAAPPMTRGSPAAMRDGDPRQESAWNPSSAVAGRCRRPDAGDAPRTARHTVQMFNIPGYVGLEPTVRSADQYHHRLSAILESVYHSVRPQPHFCRAPPYNAGPSLVNTWLGNSRGRIDPVAFIELIRLSENPQVTSRTCWLMMRFTVI